MPDGGRGQSCCGSPVGRSDDQPSPSNHHPFATMKHRLERVREVIRRELSEIVNREIAFTATLVTLQHVDLTPDLKHAHVFVSAIGSELEKADVIDRLSSHRVELQRALSKRVILKYTPHLHFKLDTSIERGDRVIELLSNIDIPETSDSEQP
jgi:ribosome-binding factor A